LTSVVQHNQEALPYLAPGQNKITVTAANPDAFGKNRLLTTYAYCLGWREQTPEEIFARQAEIARAHYATWSGTPAVVHKSHDRAPMQAGAGAGALKEAFENGKSFDFRYLAQHWMGSRRQE